MYDPDTVFANVEQGQLDDRSQTSFVLSNSKLELRVLPWCIFLLGFLVTDTEGGDRKSTTLQCLLGGILDFEDGLAHPCP